MGRVCEVERRHVKEVFEKIAVSYDRGRRPWTELVDAELAGGGDTAPLLDAGCGTGRISAHLAARCEVVCLDIARSMVRIALRRALRRGVYANLHPVQSSMVSLPFRDSSFSAVVSLAAIHHLPLRGRRVKALREFSRSLKDGGSLLVTAWSLLLPRNILASLLCRLRGEAFEFGDAYVPWRAGGRVLRRFYHLYTLRELRRDVEEAGFRVEKAYWWSPGSRFVKRNAVVVGKKRDG